MSNILFDIHSCGDEVTHFETIVKTKRLSFSNNTHFLHLHNVYSCLCKRNKSSNWIEKKTLLLPALVRNNITGKKASDDVETFKTQKATTF